MRSKRVRWLLSLAGLNVLAVSSAAHAAVVWTSTFEKGDLSEWGTPNNRTRNLPGGTTRTNIEVVGDYVYTGKYACKLTVHPDDSFPSYNQNRVDMGHQSGMLTKEGSDSWISGHYMMLADAGMRNEFAFWESNASYQNVMDFWVEPKTGGGTTIGFGVGLLGMTKVWTGDFATGKWHQVAMHVHWSTSAQAGSIDVWFDGQQVVTAYKYNTKPDMNTLFFQTGLHRRNPPPAGMNIVDTIYFDDFVEADSLADAAIATPSQPGGDGGAASEAGIDGGSGDASAAGSTDAGDAGTGATSGAGATTGGATSGAAQASGALGSTGAGATAGTTGATGANGGATTGAAGTSGTAGQGPSGSSSGCAISSGRAPATLLASAFALAGIALARRRRRG
jgi:hypothetical protein